MYEERDRLRMFQLTAARRRLGVISSACCCKSGFQLTAARRRLGDVEMTTRSGDGFNSQPPEGGWAREQGVMQLEFVSTHSRPKAAGDQRARFAQHVAVSTHSRPKAAG